MMIMMILQTIFQMIFFYFVMIPFTILMAILTSMFIYWRYFHPTLYHPTSNQSDHVVGPNFDDHTDRDDQEFDKDKQCSRDDRTKMSAAKTATTNLKNRIVMTKEIDNLLKKIVDNLIEYYLLVWYRPLIVHDQPKYQSKSSESLERFREALRDNLWKLFSCFIDRLYNVNHVTFISQDLIYRLLKHFQNLKTSPLLVNDGLDVQHPDEKHNASINPDAKIDGDNLVADDNDDNDDNVQTTKNKMAIGHRKNQSSISSIQTNFSSTSSNGSDLSSFGQPNPSNVGDLDDGDDDGDDGKHTVASQLLGHLNPFKSSTLDNGQPNSANPTGNDPNNTNDDKILFYPLASYLVGEPEEKSLIHSLARFILDTLINDSSGYHDQRASNNINYKSNSGQKLSLIRDSQTLRSFLDDLLSKILYEAIQTITQPTLINCQIIGILERNFLLKDFIMNQNDGNVRGGFGGEETDDEDEDEDDSDDDDDDDQSMSKKSVFILNEMQQCLVDNNFDQLYELIDKCNNVKLLKHIRLKLIAEILDAAVVSHLDKTVVGMDADNPQPKSSFFLFQQNDDQSNMDYNNRQGNNQSRKSSNSSSNGMVEFNGHRQRLFNFNAKMDLKFKKFRKEKNLKRLVNRLKFAKTICEQKIQFRRRTLASALPDPNVPVDSQKVEMFDYDISFKNDLVKSVSLDDSMFADAMAEGQPGADHRNHVDRPRPKHKKIFKFNQIISNEFSRGYFRKFLQQSLLQNDSNLNKRSSLMKFRKDVLLVDCTIYMFEFWLNLQVVFQTLLDWLRDPKTNSSSGTKSKSLYESFTDAYHLLLIMVADQRFFYTFSQQFLSIPSDLMRSLERFMLGDLELNAMDMTKVSFRLNQVNECFLFQANTVTKTVDQTDVLAKIDWREHFKVFERLEKILFNCLNDEFYPQFLISKEYDEILLKYYDRGPSANAQAVWMDLTKKLPIEDWHEYWTSETNSSKSYMFKMDHRLRMKPVNRILLVNGQPQRSGLNSIGDSNDRKFIDLHKNRKMLLNSIEFPFAFLSFLQMAHVTRFKLKMTIKQIVEEFVRKQRSDPEDMSMNRLLEDVLSNLGKDLMNLGQSIERIKRILFRTFCWLNADFSTVINDCRFNQNYEELLMSSTVNTAESKILSFVENLFKPSSSSSFSSMNQNQDSPQSSSSSSSNHLKFKVNVTALLSKFQYINQQPQTLPTLSTTIRNELMSNWSYQWSVDVSLQQLQTFHHRILIPFIRIIIFLARFQIKNYVTTVMDVLNGDGCSTNNDNGPRNMFPIGGGRRHSHNQNHNDIKILEKFVNKTNQILVEIRQLKRSMLTELKRTRFYFGQPNDTINTKQPVLDRNQQTGNAPESSGTISFRNLLQKEQQQQSIEVDTDVQEVTECSTLTPKTTVTDARTSTMVDHPEQDRWLKRMESLLNSYFQQIIAQDAIVKSIGFLHLIGYDQSTRPEPSSDGQQPQMECLRCQLFECVFEQNQDHHGLNHYVQMFLFRLLFDDHYHQRPNQSTTDDNSDDHYWEQLMNQMMEPNNNGTNNSDKGKNPSNRETLTTKRNHHVGLNSKLFFMQTRSLLMDRSALDCFDFTLDSLRCFTAAERTFCPECDRIMVDSRRRMIMQSSSSFSATTATAQHRSNRSKFRLFNLSLDLDEDRQSTVSSSSNLMDLIGNVGQTFGTFNLGNLFTKQQPSCSSRMAGSTLSTNNNNNNIPDLLLNGGGTSLDEPSLFSLFNDENQLIEPLFLLLIEIFELEGGTVTKTLRRTLMFGMRLFFGQTKMMSKPYKQFIQTLFTEKNVFKWMSKVNAYLEELLKNQAQAQAQSSSVTSGQQHSKEPIDHPPPPPPPSTDLDSDLRLPDVDNNEDEYLKYLNDMLGSLERQKDPSGQDHQSGHDGGVPIVQTTVMQDCNLQSKESAIGVDQTKCVAEDDGEDPVLDEEQQRQLIRDRKLQIIAKQMLFVSVPTFLSHLFGQNNIDKGVNKCFDVLQYQKLNKHLVYEFIEAFLLEYFPEFREIPTTATVTVDPIEPQEIG